MMYNDLKREQKLKWFGTCYLTFVKIAACALATGLSIFVCNTQCIEPFWLGFIFITILLAVPCYFVMRAMSTLF